MPDRRQQRPSERTGPTEARFHHLLVTGLDRVVARVGKHVLAEAMERTTRALDDVLERGSTPGAKALFDTLLADETALDELLRAYGYRLCPLLADPANDLATSAGLSDVSCAIQRALMDGRRDHSETLEIAQKLRPHMPALENIIREADEIRGAA